MSQRLPEDIIHIVCDVLYAQEDLATLYQLAVCSKNTAPLALSCLYRMHKGAGPNEDENVGFDSSSILALQKWSVAWRSIISSTFDGETLFPYHKYLKVLDLRDFRSLIEDSRFLDKIAKVFFAGRLSDFRVERKVKTTRRTITRLDITAIVDAVGDALAPKTTTVEQLSGEFTSDAFSRWISNLPRLKRLEMWDGEPLTNVMNHELIYSTCPCFNALSMYRWMASNADELLGRFISGLPEQTLKSFVTFNNCGVSTETCLALARHSYSLTELHLCFSADTISSMALLRSCTGVERLKLEIPPTLDLEANHNDVFNDLMSWIRECESLKSLELDHFKCAASLLAPLLVRDVTPLEELVISGDAPYIMKDCTKFHQALANLSYLKALDLYGDAEECSRDDIDALVESLGKVSTLKKLKLRGVSDYFSDESIMTLLLALQDLEEVWVSGLSSSDDVLSVLPTLPHLRSITYAAFNSTFTSHGLMTAVEQLGPGNSGLEINVPFAEPSQLIHEDELNIVRDAIFNKVGGRLEYQATRDPDVSEFEGDSD